MTNDDRFLKISNDYGELFSEVFAEQGMDYEKLEKSVFDKVSEIEPNFKNLSILDCIRQNVYSAWAEMISKTKENH